MSELRAEAVVDLATPRELDLSPDGRLVVYAMAPHGKREEHGTGALWVAPVDGSGAPRQFTAGVANDRRPRWSPDGKEVAFLSDRATRGTAQLYVIPAAGGEARAVTEVTLKRPVLDFAWSPGGGHLAFTSADEPDAEDERRTRERDDARVYGERHAYARLRVLSRATGEVTTLAGGERHITAFAWSPDGAQLAYVAQRTPALESREAGVTVERVSLAGGEPRLVCPFPIGLHDFVWCTDGRTLLFAGPAARAPQSSNAVYAVPAEGGTPRLLVLGEHSCAGELQQPRAAPLAVVAVARGLETQLCWLDPVSGATQPCYPPTGAQAPAETGIGAWCARWVGRGRASSAAGDAPAGELVLAAVCSTGHQPWEVWAGRFPGPAAATADAAGEAAGSGAPPRGHAGLRRLTTHQQALQALAFGRQEPFSWAAPDGWELDGLLIYPPAASPEPTAAPASDPLGQHGPDPGGPAETAARRPLPAVVLVHGGPYGRWGHGFHLGALNWAQWLALAGYAVLLPNPRGGSGHGEAFAAAARGEVGRADYRDVMAAVDAAVERGIVDPHRLAIGGWSQGGFMAAWAVTQTRRFKAAIMGAGISDWGMMVMTSDLPRFERALGGSAPWDGLGPHRHAELSPISFARAVTTPVLILHGERDRRVPVSQAIGFHRALRECGVPAELVIYPREPHGIEERAHQIDLLRRVRTWCDRWLRP